MFSNLHITVVYIRLSVLSLFWGKLSLPDSTVFLFVPYGPGGAELHDP